MPHPLIPPAGASLGGADGRCIQERLASRISDACAPKAPLMRHLLGSLAPEGPKGRLSILILHRVCKRLDPLLPDLPDATRFDTMCSWLRSWFNVLPLDKALCLLSAHALPARALAITFDDGYADNHEVALPILARHGLSATFFIATGFLDGGCMWNDVVIESVRRTSLPTLDLRGMDVPGLGLHAVGTVEQKRAVIGEAVTALKYLAPDRRSVVVQELAARSGVVPPSNLMMGSRQVLELRRAAMQIGAHTVTHPILAGLEALQAEREMADSKRFLEGLLDEPVELFAYPNGKWSADFNACSVGLAKALGFKAALTTDWGSADARTDLFRLPRFTPWDRTRLRFGLRLATNLWHSRSSVSQAASPQNRRDGCAIDQGKFEHRGTE